MVATLRSAILFTINSPGPLELRPGPVRTAFLQVRPLCSCVIPFFVGVGFMRKHFFLLAASFFACAAVLSAQDYMYKIDLIPSGAMITMSQPMLQGDSYVFRSWPDGATSAV